MNSLAYPVELKVVRPEDPANTPPAELSKQVEALLHFHVQNAQRLLTCTAAVAQRVKLQPWTLFEQLNQILPLLEARRNWELQRYWLGEFGFVLANLPGRNQTGPGTGSVPAHNNPRAMLHEISALTNDYRTYERLTLRHTWLIGNQPPGLGHILHSHAQRLRQDAWFLQSAYSRANRHFCGPRESS